jgi:hypothetical protein
MAGPKTIYIPVNGTDHYFKNKIYKIKDVNGSRREKNLLNSH